MSRSLNHPHLSPIGQRRADEANVSVAPASKWLKSSSNMCSILPIPTDRKALIHKASRASVESAGRRAKGEDLAGVEIAFRVKRPLEGAVYAK